MKFSLSTSYAKLTLFTFLAVVLLTAGGRMVAFGASGADCASWPLCLPANISGLEQILHRLSAGFASLLMLALLFHAWRTQRDHRPLLPLTTVTVTLFFAQAFVGAILVTRNFPADLQVMHALTAFTVWVSLTALVVTAGFYAKDAVAFPPLDVRQRLKDFVILTKPVIVGLLLVTTFAGMVSGGKAWPSFSLAFWTLLGGALAAGGSGALNQYIDRDLDRNMQRTAVPVPCPGSRCADVTVEIELCFAEPVPRPRARQPGFNLWLMVRAGIGNFFLWMSR